MRLYSIGKKAHAHDITGLGAKLHGGRWNYAGIPCIYLADNRALSLLEYSAHTALHLLPPSLSFTTFEVPDHSIKELTENELPITWLQQPFCKDSQDIGSALLKQKDHLLLKMPSVVLEQEFNFVLNTMHPLISAVKIIDVDCYSM
jgi:RES domain-containing protein